MLSALQAAGRLAQFWLETFYLTFAQASLLIMRCGSSSLSSSSSSQLGEGVPSAPNVALQEPPLLSLGSNGSTTMGSVPLISQRQKGHPVPWPSDSCNMGTQANVTSHRGDRRLYIHTLITEHIRLHLLDPFQSISLTCQAVRHEVHIRWPQGSIFTSLSFSAQILQSWKVEPISQYSSYCSWQGRQMSVNSVSEHRVSFYTSEDHFSYEKNRSV